MSIITTLRRSMGMTQEAFAEFCDISRISIARYDAGAPISRKNAEKIAKACGISIDCLLDFTPSEKANGLMKEPQTPYLSEKEEHLVNDYRELSPHGKKRVLETLKELKILYPRKQKKTSKTQNPSAF